MPQNSVIARVTGRFFRQLMLMRDADVVWRLADAGDVAPHLHWLP